MVGGKRVDVLRGLGDREEVVRLAGRGLEDQLRRSFGEVLRVRVDGGVFHFTDREENFGLGCIDQAVRVELHGRS